MEITHDVRQRKFYTVAKGLEYSIEYNDIERDLWEFHCPVFPNGKFARSVQDQLIEYAFYFMKRNRIKMLEEVSCPYIQEFLEKRQELASAVK